MKYDDLKKELSHKERSIDDLVSYLKTRTSVSNPNYSLLLGSGASVTSGIRSGGQLVETWRKEIYELHSGEVYKDVQTAKTYLMTNEGSWYSEQNEYSSLFEKKFDLPSQRRRFVEQEVDSATPSIGYAYMVSLSNESDRYIGPIYTTNFDDLINEAFYQFSLNRPLVCAHDSSVNSLSVGSTRPKIIKLHGDYLFDDIKSTLRETESLEVNIKNKFVEFSKEYGLIVIGYAGHDRSIMDVLNHLLKSEDYFKNGVYWCIRDSDEISPELRKLIWRERVYFVKISGYDELMAELHHKLIGCLPIKNNLFESKHDRI
ncbi:SIR2 family protein, partial [Vibrio cholerae]|nr:SIR2 family protein [Vibrio cholerae]